MAKPIKIAISGVNSAHRAETIEALAERFKGRSIILPELKPHSRIFNGFATPSRQYKDLEKYLSREKAAMSEASEKEVGIVICDLGIVDFFVRASKTSSPFKKSELVLIEAFLEGHVPTYDMVAYQPDEPMKRFGTSSESIKTQQEIGDISRNKWIKNGARFMELNGDIHQRMSRITAGLSLVHDFV